MKMPLRKHQKETVEKIIPIIKHKSCVYLFGEPRVGKSLIACEVYDQLRPILCDKDKRCLVLTKKNAILGWEIFTKEYEGIDVINYEKVGKFTRDKYHFVVVDEAHNFSTFPKWTQRIKDVRQFCKGKPVLLLSGTPVVEGLHRLYSPFALASNFSPFWKWTNPYKFFREFGIPNPLYLNGRTIERYDTFMDEKILKICEDRIVRVTLHDAGFDYENQDLTLYIESEDVLDHQHNILKTRFFSETYDVTEYDSGNVWIEPLNDSHPLENISAVNQALHRLCGGFYRDLNLPKPKLEWLKRFVRKHKKEKIAVMCYFIEEQENLPRLIDGNIDVYSSTKYCEGVDLSHYDHLILYSFGYSGAKFVQLRDRIVNINKERNTTVIIPLIRGGLDEEIYKVVSQKKDFNMKMVNSKWQ